MNPQNTETTKRLNTLNHTKYVFAIAIAASPSATAAHAAKQRTITANVRYAHGMNRRRDHRETAAEKTGLRSSVATSVQRKSSGTRSNPTWTPIRSRRG